MKNMKKAVLSLLLCFFCNIIAIANNIGDTQEIVETNMAKDIMWTNLKKWVSSTFNSYEHAVDLEDKDAGTIIIKWKNRFAPKVSKHLRMIASSTIKIDVKEGKYRYDISNSQIEIETHIGDTSDLSYAELQEGIIQVEAFLRLCNNEYNRSTEWAINEKLVNLVSQYKEKLDATTKYKNERKGKLSKEWEKANCEYEILNIALNGYNTISQAIINSLKKSMVENDEW